MVVAPVVSIAYHSGYGHTAVLARALESGAAEAGADVCLIKVDEITSDQWARLDSSDAIIFGAPTYMGSASGAFHAFAESTSKRWNRQDWKDKLAAGFTNSSSKAGDKDQALRYFQTLAFQHGMNWVCLGLLPGWNSSTGSEHDLNRLGYYAGAGAQTNLDEGIEAVHPSDIATAAHLGRRVTKIARVFKQGHATEAEDVSEKLPVSG
ncbi:flavodoxin family protein [Streptomyces sp. DSM 41524]|uniref:Flavodoxin family protein n=1 Tax=Streptomyces asiaticus subsp. ignotus TaxID=3098222 RepID=A0ABU7Q730_9ACTN|nr:flavodoxin family protein [Streptomyces sp. DSM 41524]